MTRLLVLEAAPQRLEVGSEDRVLSLRPQASSWLDRQQLPYQIPADVGAETALRQREAAYWQGQLAWLDLLDGMLKEQVPALSSRGIHATTLYGFHLKHMVDYLFIRGLEAAVALEAERPARVVLWSAISSARPSLERFACVVRPDGMIAAIWKRLCDARGMAYEERPSPPPSSARTAQWQVENAPVQRAVSRARSAVREVEWLVRARMRGNARASGRQLTLLLLETNHDLTALLHDAQRAGHRCLVRRGDRITDPSRLGWSRTVSDDRGGAGEQSAEPWSAAAESICAPSSPLWGWPDTWFGCSMEPLLGTWLRSWISEELPQLVALSDRYADILSSERVDFVMTSSLVFRPHAAAVAAGCRSPSTKTVLVAHGSGPDEAASWDLFELFPYDHYFIPDEEFADYFRGRRTYYNGRPMARVQTGSYRWHGYTQLAHRPRVYVQRGDEGRLALRINQPPVTVPRTKPVIVYVAGKPDTMRYLNKWDCADTWYYRLQTALIQALRELTDYTFVIKLPPCDRTADVPIVEFIRDLRASHLVISWSPFVRWLPWADRVIMDFPSTPLYETALANVPFHLLVHRSFTMRSTALEQFATSIGWYEQPEEAAEAVRGYLRSPIEPRSRLVAEEHDLLAELYSLVEERHELAQNHR